MFTLYCFTYFGYEESPRPSTAKDTPDKEFDGRFLLSINLQNFCKTMVLLGILEQGKIKIKTWPKETSYNNTLIN